MHDPDALIVSSPPDRRWGRFIAWGIPALFLVLVLGVLVASFAGRLSSYAQVRLTGGIPYHADRVQVLSAVWVKRDFYQITVRLSRSDGKLLIGHYGVRLIDTAPGGYGEISDYLGPAPTQAQYSTVDVVAYQRLPGVPQGPLTLRIDGYHQVPQPLEPAWVQYFLGPIPPRPAIVRYPLAGGVVTLPAPPKHLPQKASAD